MKKTTLIVSQKISVPLVLELTRLPNWPNLEDPRSLVGSFGICNMPCIPLRAAPSDGSELEGQLLFGEPFHVLEAEGGCLKVQRLFRDAACVEWGSMQGWIDNHLVPATVVSEEEMKRLLHKAPRAIVASHTVRAIPTDGKGAPLTLPFGSLLPDYDSGGPSFMMLGTRYRIETPSARIISEKAKPDLGLLTELLNEFYGVQYLWGGQNTWGVDCSGFTQNVMRVFGVELPRNCSAQVKLGEEISTDQAQSGDLVFFRTINREKPSHVGFLIKGEDGDFALFHAKQRVKCQLMVNQHDDAKKYIYPEGLKTVEMMCIRRLVSFV